MITFDKIQLFSLAFSFGIFAFIFWLVQGRREGSVRAVTQKSPVISGVAG